MVYIPMSQRTTEAYREAFTALKELKSTLSPVSIMTDYEAAAVRAFHEVFPEAEQRGCYFHYQQAIWRKIQTLPELLKEYKKENVTLAIKQITALAFVPEEYVQGTFEEISGQPIYVKVFQLDSFIDYFAKTWVGYIDVIGRRKRPLYAPALWNCHEAVIAGLPKTSNAIEGWYNSFFKLVDSCHPSLWAFLDALKTEQGLTQACMLQDAKGYGRQEQLEKEEKLKELVLEYGKDPLLD